jgi:hypothetical protein
MKSFLTYLFTAPVVTLFTISFLASLLIEINRFFPDSLIFFLTSYFKGSLDIFCIMLSLLYLFILLLIEKGIFFYFYGYNSAIDWRSTEKNWYKD